MKLLKKLNKGVILTILVLTILVIYIVNLEVQRNKEKTQIQEVCRQYLAFEDKYTVLPEEYQNSKNEVPQEKLKEYKKEMTEELKKLMVNNEEIYNLQKSIIEDKIDTQSLENKIITSKNSKIVKISKYEFDDDQVTVTIEDLVEIETKTLNNTANSTDNEEQIENKKEKIEDTITLKKEAGKWKVIYANVGIIEDFYGNYYGMEIVL